MTLNPSPAPTEVSAAPALAMPLRANWRGQLRVTSIVNETPMVKTFNRPIPQRRILDWRRENEPLVFDLFLAERARLP
jgi:hypothetical protein